MRIGIVGNCQSGVMAQWLKKLRPSDDIVHHSIARPAETYGPAGDDLARCDIVISQPVGPGHGPLETGLLRNSVPQFVLVPNLVFTGYQPDMMYLYHDNGCIVVSPLGAYHSRIIAACYYLGFGPVRTRKMFNSYIFEILGYFDEFDKAKLNFEDALTAQGLDLDVASLFERGRFMHTINHADSYANRVMTAAAVRAAGLEPLDDVDEVPDDMLEDTVWPVYPQIAARIGCDDGSLTFTRAAHLATTDGMSRRISLEQMIDQSFDIYARCEGMIDFTPIYGDAAILRSAIKRKYRLPAGSDPYPLKKRRAA